jgi:hypothetical protein
MPNIHVAYSSSRTESDTHTTMPTERVDETATRITSRTNPIRALALVNSWHHHLGRITLSLPARNDGIVRIEVNRIVYDIQLSHILDKEKMTPVARNPAARGLVLQVYLWLWRRCPCEC